MPICIDVNAIYTSPHVGGARRRAAIPPGASRDASPFRFLAPASSAFVRFRATSVPLRPALHRTSPPTGSRFRIANDRRIAVASRRRPEHRGGLAFPWRALRARIGPSQSGAAVRRSVCADTKPPGSLRALRLPMRGVRRENARSQAVVAQMVGLEEPAFGSPIA
jgi:hypothetical protein